jgi:hypothetical protein
MAVRQERIWRLAGWLELLATHEEGSARALTRMGSHADPKPALTRARLFREIAGYLENRAVEAESAPEAPMPQASAESPLATSLPPRTRPI